MTNQSQQGSNPQNKSTQPPIEANDKSSADKSGMDKSASKSCGC